MTLERGSRDDTTARSPVSARFVFSPFSFATSPSFLSAVRGLTLRAFSASSFFFFFSSSSCSFFFHPRERRQVGIRAAVNSPAPLSALMSLLLFALLNAIRAYSVSLPPLLRTRATTSSFRLPRYTTCRLTHVGALARPHAYAHTQTHTHTHTYRYTHHVHANLAGDPQCRARLSRFVAGAQAGTRGEHARNTPTRKDVTRGIAPRGRRGHSNQPQTCIRTLLCNF